MKYITLFLLIFVLNWVIFALCGCGISRLPPTTVALSVIPRAGANNSLAVHFLNYNSDEPKYLGKPYVIIYINEKPFKLTLDTGSTGVMVTRAALRAEGLSLPHSGYFFTGRFKRSCSTVKKNIGFSGYITYARVSTAFKGGLSTPPNFPLAVNTSNCFYPGGLDGTFGMGLSPHSSIGKRYNNAKGEVFTPSAVTGFPKGFNNGFILKLSSIFNRKGRNNSGRGYKGEIIFGLNTEPDNCISKNFHFFPDMGYKKGYISEYPMINYELGVANINRTADKNYLSVFDTGSLEENYILDDVRKGGVEVYGLPAMFNRTMYWEVNPWGIGFEGDDKN
jgi:hypothetical protein